MINHFKAEFYKLRHSKILITILGVCAAVIMVSFALGDMTFFGAGDGTESVIGFQAKCYLSSEIPTFQTVARSSLAYTAFFWIIGILFATIFFTKEYNTGTIKLSVAYGTKRTILYYTKAITILVVSLITYLIFVATFFVIEIIQSGYIPTASEVINLLGCVQDAQLVHALVVEDLYGVHRVSQIPGLIKLLGLHQPALLQQEAGDDAGTAIHAQHLSAKFFSSFMPYRWLFSGWNCTP